MHVSFNVKEGEGPDLSKEYKVGHTYPVFILTNSGGDIIYRWTGYTGARNFISSIDKSLSNLTTIKKRIRDFNSKPTQAAAVMLARYFTDTGEHLDAIRFYRRAEELKRNPPADYSYDIFSNSANAAWKDMMPFDEALSAADSILYAKRKNSNSSLVSKEDHSNNKTSLRIKMQKRGLSSQLRFASPSSFNKTFCLEMLDNTGNCGPA